MMFVFQIFDFWCKVIKWEFLGLIFKHYDLVGKIRVEISWLFAIISSFDAECGERDGKIFLK